LIELMISISVIAALAAIALPNIMDARRVAQERKAVVTIKAIYAAQLQYRAKNGVYAASVNELVLKGLLADPFKGTGATVQPNGFWEFATRVPSIAPVSPADKFRIMCEPVGTTTADRLRTGDQIYFMLENGQLYTHRYQAGCSLSHGDS